MGYKTKIQKVERPTNRSYYVNLPSALAQVMEIKKGEEFEWILEDKNLILLQRINKIPKYRRKNLKIKRSDH